MEVCDLGLSSRADIDALRRIFKDAQSAKLNFASIQLSLKNAARRGEICSLEKYLHFFMIVKSECKDDSPLAWTHHFHVFIRRLEREIMASVTYHRSLMGRAFQSLKIQLKMKIMDTYFVTEDRIPTETIDPTIKVKARIFHCWKVHTALKRDERQQQQETQSLLSLVQGLHNRNSISHCLGIWERKHVSSRQIVDKIKAVGENIQLHRGAETLRLMSQQKQLRHIKQAIQEKIASTLAKLSKRHFLARLATNLGSIQKPKQIRSYHALKFLQYLLESCFNQRKTVDFEDLCAVLPLKSKVRREAFSIQVGILHRELSGRAFQSWVSLVKQRKEVAKELDTMLCKSRLREFSNTVLRMRNLSQKVADLKRILVKRCMRILRLRVESSKLVNKQFALLCTKAKAEARSILRKSGLERLQKGSQQQGRLNSCYKLVSQRFRRHGINVFIGQASRWVNACSVEGGIDGIVSKNSLRSCFGAWVKFCKGRANNLVQLSIFQDKMVSESQRHFIVVMRGHHGSVNQRCKLQNQLTTYLFNRKVQMALQIARVNLAVQDLPRQVELLSKVINARRLIQGLRKRHQESQVLQRECLASRNKNLKLNSYRALLDNLGYMSGRTARLAETLKTLAISRVYTSMSVFVGAASKIKVLDGLRNEKLSKAILTIRHFSAAQRMTSQKLQDLDVCLLRLSKLKALRCLCMRGRETKEVLASQQATRNRLKIEWFSRLRQDSLRAKTTQSSLLCLVQFLQKSISANRIKFFEGRVKQVLLTLHNDMAISQRQHQLSLYTKTKSQCQFLVLASIKPKTTRLLQAILETRQDSFRFLFRQLSKEVKISKRNDCKMEPFRGRRVNRVKRDTITSLRREMLRRADVLDKLSTVFRIKQLLVLKDSLGSIFQEFKVAFKLCVCLKARKRICLQQFIAHHMRRSESKLMEYKSIRHYASKLLQKGFQGLSHPLATPNPRQSNSDSSIHKTLPKYDRTY